MVFYVESRYFAVFGDFGFCCRIPEYKNTITRVLDVRFGEGDEDDFKRRKWQ